MMLTTYRFCVLFLTVFICITITTQKLAKDIRCHMLKNPGCNVSLYKILDYEEAGWFYHAPFRSCRPFYANEGSRCQPNRDLPLTREECEDLCGERCKLPNGENGICMMEGSCNIDVPASSNPRPCYAYNVQCCPKSTDTYNMNTD
ncbi:hypothetical protein PGB90_000076 [Kerria lacca]